MLLQTTVTLASMIGYGYDLIVSDLWTYQGLLHMKIFDNFTSDCIVEYDCPHVATTINQNFTSTNSWYQYFSKTTGINTDDSWDGLDFSVSRSMGQDDSYAWWTERSSTYVATSNIQSCSIISDDCSPYNMLSADFVNSLTSLPLISNDKNTMELWRSAFIARYGTHYAAQANNGAQIKVLSSVDVACEESMDCLVQDVCFDLSFVSIYGKSICHDEDQCKTSDGCTETLSTQCVLNGGDPAISASTLCTNDATEEELDNFLKSGDLNSESSTVSAVFKSLADLAAGAGYYKESLQLGNAIDYVGCKQPWVWLQDGDSNSHSCQCNLQCQNGGKLDTNTCTCSCVGDSAHGWTGQDCTETYGKCQCAAGSRPDGEDDCCVNGNICGSAHDNPTCGDTELCCNKAQYAVCCPFGSSCDASSTMYANCVTGRYY